MRIRCIKPISNLCEEKEEGDLETLEYISWISNDGWGLYSNYIWWQGSKNFKILFKMKKEFSEEDIYKQIGNFNLNQYFTKIN